MDEPQALWDAHVKAARERRGEDVGDYVIQATFEAHDEADTHEQLLGSGRGGSSRKPSNIPQAGTCSLTICEDEAADGLAAKQ